MADEQTSDRDITIQSTINVGTANDKTTVSGAKVSVGSAREVNIHGDTTPPPSFRSVALVGVLAFLGAVLINIATSQLPPGLQPYLWLAWPLAVLVTAASIWVAYWQSRSAGSSVTIGNLDERNRARMLDKVENFWIKGVLEQSLYQIARLELGLEQAPELVNHPWQTILQQTTGSQAVPASTSVINLFDRLDSKLLILGAPGAGKTTLLLELTRDLIARGRSDSQHPIPMVFNLSTWANKRQPLKEWLADELNQRYDVPRKLASAWVEADAILPLLDGLDEVVSEQHTACVEAINAYRHERSQVPLAVCSREEAYARLTGKLKLQGAIIVQPLTQQKVDNYLRQVGRPLAAVRAALRDDPMLRELLDNPLMLSIVALAYKDTTPARLRAVGTLDDRRRQLFNDFIAAMFTRVGRSAGAAPYTKSQTKHWLNWLAGQMVKHNKTVFYIEELQPSWLLGQRRQHLVMIVVAVCCALGLGLSVGVSLGVDGGLSIGLLGAFGFALIGGAIGYSPTITPVDTLHWSWTSARVSAMEYSIFGLLCGLFAGLIIGSGVGVMTGLDAGLVVGLRIGLFVGLIALLGVALGIVLLSSLIDGLTTETLELHSRPNQGIFQSARSAIVVGLILCSFVGVVVPLAGLVAEKIIGPGIGLAVKMGVNSQIVLGFGLLSGLVCALYYGGRPVLQHYTLRWMLYRNGSLPLRLVPFLDYCAERIFLRKVGGGYIFVHRLLMEHFASLYTEQPPAEPVEAQRTSS